MRKNYLDVAKGLGILLVVLGHSLEVYLGNGNDGTRGAGFVPATFAAWKFIYSFHMPLFFILSGIATTRLTGTKFENTLASALNLIVIATALQLLSAPLRLAIPLPTDAPATSLSAALRYVFWPALKLETYAIVVIWFLPCLALVRLAAWLVGNASRPGMIILALGALCLAEQHFGIGYFQMRSVIVGLAFFALGQRIGDLRPDRFPRIGYAAVCAGALLLTALTFEANHGCPFDLASTCPGPRYGEFAVLMVSGAFGFLPLFALTALAGAAAILSASLLLAHSRLLALIGRRTLDLLIVNGVTLVFIQPVLTPYAANLPRRSWSSRSSCPSSRRPSRSTH